MILNVFGKVPTEVSGLGEVLARFRRDFGAPVRDGKVSAGLANGRGFGAVLARFRHGFGAVPPRPW